MNRGIVMDVQKQSVLVLTSEGEFVKCKKQHREYEIGEEILFPQAERIKQRNKFLFSFWPKRFAFAASSVLALCLVLFFNSPAEEKAMAYVAVDINPSLEMTVDSELHVMKLEAYNDDGRRVLSKLKSWEDESLSTVIRAIVRQSQQDGYLKADKQVTITSVAASGADEQIEKRIDAVVTTVQKAYEKEAIKVLRQKSTLQMREDAKRAGVSAGIYMEQEKEKLQQQAENKKLEQAPAIQEEQSKPQPVQPPAEKQREVPLVPSTPSNTAPPQQKKEEQGRGPAVNKEKAKEQIVEKEVKKTEQVTKQEKKVEQKQEKKQEQQVKKQIKEVKAKPSPPKNEKSKEEKQNKNNK